MKAKRPAAFNDFLMFHFRDPIHDSRNKHISVDYRNVIWMKGEHFYETRLISAKIKRHKNVIICA